MGFFKTDEELTFRRIIERVGDTTHYQAKYLEAEFGDIDVLEQATAEAVLAVQQIGPKTIENIGIWDENGDPVDTITRKPCAVCGNEYAHYIRLMGEDIALPADTLPESTAEWTMCVADSHSGATLYAHER